MTTGVGLFSSLDIVLCTESQVGIL